ncbi:hypothetical protein [Corynebacterium aquatimens]|uniref:Secreted protein n=1 Tax=Corynebacterium aquatimens TaxID=1190508 RepID=A0A931DYC1_9CORY|nr:hypothetical protein [Corynebacterium aquatimens]MBG6121249.1 hypothetical protein [Corynebacterium aquatimens]WJY66199.1 hypothetical protein CAQUA_07515 [Corynebacterium aquatimens]
MPDRMRTVFRASSFTAAVILTATTLSACIDKEIEEPDLSGSQSSSSARNAGNGDGGDNAGNGSNKSTAWYKAYRDVLSDPAKYPLNDAVRFTPTNEFYYALVEANGGGAPELLLAHRGEDFSPVIVFTISQPGGTVASTDNLIMGVASAGGDRMRLESSISGEGLYQIDWTSTSHTGSSQKYKLEGSNPVAAGTAEQFPNLDLLPDHQVIRWTRSDDLSALDAGIKGSVADPDQFPGGRGGVELIDRNELEGGSGSAAGSRDTGHGAARSAAGADGVTDMGSGQAVAIGTVRKVTAGELMDSGATPNGEPADQTHYILQFDHPVTVTAKKLNGVFTYTQDYAALGEKSQFANDSGRWERFVGKRVRITSSDLWYPTDASLPLGVLRVGNATNVEVL